MPPPTEEQLQTSQTPSVSPAAGTESQLKTSKLEGISKGRLPFPAFDRAREEYT